MAGDPAKTCHVLTQYVAQSLNRLGLCAKYSSDIENDENVFFWPGTLSKKNLQRCKKALGLKQKFSKFERNFGVENSIPGLQQKFCHPPKKAWKDAWLIVVWWYD